MSSDRNSPPLPSPTDRRRSSLTGQFIDLFGRSPPASNGLYPNHNHTNNATAAYPGPIATAAAQAHRRRLSVTTMGLSGSPPQPSPFGTVRSRGESISSATSANVDESPFDDDQEPPSTSNPTTPFARRLSFGARALRDVRANNGNLGNPNGRPSVDRIPLLSPPAKGRGEGFNIAENLRSRAERGSFSGTHPLQSPPAPQVHQRAKSLAVMEPPAREMPREPKVPDAFQERILKGDFYMD